MSALTCRFSLSPTNSARLRLLTRKLGVPFVADGVKGHGPRLAGVGGIAARVDRRRQRIAQEHPGVGHYATILRQHGVPRIGAYAGAIPADIENPTSR